MQKYKAAARDGLVNERVFTVGEHGCSARPPHNNAQHFQDSSVNLYDLLRICISGCASRLTAGAHEDTALVTAASDKLPLGGKRA